MTVRPGAGEAPPNEEPSKPFGLVRLPTLDEELGHRQPLTAKEREFSHHTIQVNWFSMFMNLGGRMSEIPAFSVLQTKSFLLAN